VILSNLFIHDYHIFLMGWYALVSLISDGRVKFLLKFVIIAVVVAGILTLIEIRLKRKKDKRLAKVEDESVIEKMTKFLKKDYDLKEKLDFIDKTAKVYFRDIYGTRVHAGYSELIAYFEKRGRKSEAVFCKEMFATYYSGQELTVDKIISLGRMLVNVDIKKKNAEELSRVPSFMEKVDRGFDKVQESFSKRKKDFSDRCLAKKVEENRRLNTTKMQIVVPEKNVLPSERNDILLNQTKKDSRKIRKMKIARFKYNQKVQAKKDKEVAKMNKRQEVVAREKVRDLARSAAVRRNVAAKKRAAAIKEAIIEAKIKEKNDLVIAKRKKKDLAYNEKEAKRRMKIQMKNESPEVRFATKRRAKELLALKKKKIEEKNDLKIKSLRDKANSLRSSVSGEEVDNKLAYRKSKELESFWSDLR